VHDASLTPVALADTLGRRVVGQARGVEEMAIALAKKLAGLPTGNVLLIGSSGTGKTTLMRSVEEVLAARSDLAHRSTQIRVHANVLAEEAESGHPGEAVVRRLLERARDQLGREAPFEQVAERARDGIVFVDEIDKIRALVGGEPHLAGIRAQEALLTLMENATVPVTLPEWAGGGATIFDAARLWFVGAGAFEGLYDAVRDRVTLGRDRGALQPTTVVSGSTVHQETRFHLGDWLRNEDLFDYGMSPQFLSRFDSIVLLRDLSVDDLVRIFLDSPDSGYRQSLAYFAYHGVDLAVSPAAVRRIAEEAAARPRVGARALKEVFRRVVRSYELDPVAAGRDGAIVVDLPEVEAVLGVR
jgi:ATP-dependent Clp protease ATP-binding subunit ClpX